MSRLRNLFACLVHESPECAVDLVRNLRHLDPASPIILYNGGENPGLLKGSFPFERHDVLVHPRPHRQRWGRLHGFALDCLRLALERFTFDTLTIVDSDQLAVRPGYSDYLGRALGEIDGLGLLSSAPGRHPRDSAHGPVAAVWREIELWRPFLRRFTDGEEKFPHWTFWPSTVFTATAAKDLVDLFDRDQRLTELLRRTKIWATEEVFFPTLVALLGYRVEANPCSYEYVRYKTVYRPRDLERALERRDVHWIHPVPRRYDHPLRQRLRQRFDHYRSAPRPVPAKTDDDGARPLLVTLPILERVRPIEGWLEDDEADLLITAGARALSELPAPHAWVEVGSYCGKSTVLLGSVAETARGAARVYAIDPHQGMVGALDRGLEKHASTLGRFEANIAAAGLQDVVETVPHLSYEVRWERPISLILIDGLHDYVNVARDFLHFEPWLVEGAYAAFHDYADYYPGVQAFVNELLASGAYREVRRARSMIVVRKTGAALAELRALPPAAADDAASARPKPAAATAGAPQPPLVSCIMPTRDRRFFVPRAIRYFQRQDYPRRELLVVDDGDDAVGDLIPDDAGIRYLRLGEKTSLGEKRNRACREARGSIVVHWDDDDWMAPWRIRYQVERLLAEGADLCGLSRLYFYDPAAGRAWEYRCPRRGKTWLAGGTFCYRRDLWRANPFPDTDLGEDVRFLWSPRPKKLAILDDPSFYVALLHDANTQPSRLPRSGAAVGALPPGWHALRPTVLERLLGADRAEYEDLRSPVTPARAVPAPRRRPGPGGARPLAQRGPARRRSAPLGSRLRVSCLMPTRGRRRFAAQAIRYFLRQDYPEKELVIVDDSPEGMADLIPAGDPIRYLHLPGTVSLGQKRNLAAEHGQGEILVHWDDDDWSASGRLSAQVEPLVRGEAQISGFADTTFYELEEARFWRCSPQLYARMFFAGVHGRSVAYLAELWGRHARYPDVSLAEDARFLESLTRKRMTIARIAGGDKFIYVRHAGSSWRFRCGELIDRSAWQSIPPPAFLPPEDLSFYQPASSSENGAH